MSIEQDTIAALVTPVGEAGLAVIRISGPRAQEILRDLCFTKEPNKGFPSHLLVGAHIKGGDGKTIDKVMVVYMQAPKTYTGEDVVEIFCHGGCAVAKMILNEAINRGARIAQRGEFTKRAFLSGKMDLSQAEGVVGLVRAKTPEAVILAEAQVEGGLSKKIKKWREGLISVLAALEADIDFSEDLPPVDAGEIKGALEGVMGGLKGLLKTASTGTLATTGQLVAIIGKPNVGKSSLLNALLKEEKAIVTEVPGTTRDMVEGLLDIKGVLLKIVDTAGLREAGDKVEKVGIARTTLALQSAALALLVIDGSRDLSKEDEALLDKAGPERTILVINKSDLPQAGERKKEGIQKYEKVQVSALTGEGIERLEETIYNYFVSKLGFSLDSEVVLTNERHVEAIARSQGALEKALDSLDKKMASEFMALDIKEAVLALGEVTGEEVSEEIIEKVFSSFCVGK